MKRLAARLDKYDYKLDLKSKILVLKLHNGYEARLKLLASDERIEKYLDWSSYELAVKYDGESLWVSIYFRKGVALREAKTVMTIDSNFDNVTLCGVL